MDPKVLADLGWSPEDVQAFVEKYRGRLDNRRPEPERTAIPGRVENLTGRAGSLRRGGGVEARLKAIRDRAPALEKDRLRRLVEARRDTVSPEYRELLEAYLKALSEGR